MIKLKNIICLFILLPFFWSNALAGDLVKDSTIRAFIVHSYENNNVCGIPQGDGIRSVLNEYFKNNIIIKTYFMDTKTINSTPVKMRLDAQKVIGKIEAFKPDIVFTIDDNAFREVGLKLAGRAFPVVFSGMNAQVASYSQKVQFLNKKGQPDSNITGVYEKLHFMTALSVMKGVTQDLKQVVALLDKSPTGNAIKKQMEKEIAESDSTVIVRFKQVGTVKEFLHEIDLINQDDKVQVVYPVVLSIQDESGKSVGFKVTIKQFIINSKKPGMALNFAFARLGLFGGASVDFGAMGRQTGELGLKLLKDENILNLPVESANEYLITFNIARANMLGFTIPDEIVGAAVIYNEMLLLPDGIK